jgi:hypothetical protein
MKENSLPPIVNWRGITYSITDIDRARMAIIGIPLIRLYKSVSRNDKCPCGSGKKFKNCECSQKEGPDMLIPTPKKMDEAVEFLIKVGVMVPVKKAESIDNPTVVQELKEDL